MTRLQELTDHHDIEATLARYARAVDSRDFDLVASCFTEDVHATYNGVALEPGVDSIIRSARVASQYAATTHFISNVVSDIRGDEADVVSYVIVAMAQNPANPGSVIKLRGAHNHDRFVRRGNNWLIQRRTLQVDWASETPSLPTSLQQSSSNLPQQAANA